MARPPVWLAIVILLVAVGACSKKQPPVARPTPPPPPAAGAAGPAAPAPVVDPPIVPFEPLPEEGELGALDLDQLNRESPLAPVFFAFDSAEVDAAGQTILQANAQILRQYATWVVTLEGHCDERGTAEYNLALGERRALAARNYLVSLGIPADRLRTVSYGKEFPFDPRSNEEAWAQNRRAHFVITAK